VRRALGAIADRFFGHPTGQRDLVGVTGTNGKTTVTWLIEAIAAAAGRAPGVIGTIACRWDGREGPAANTTPEAPELQRTLREMAEAGWRRRAQRPVARARAEARRLLRPPLQNLGRDHLDFHPDLEDYFAAKARLFTDFAPGASVINLDDARGAALAAAAAARGAVVTYGLGEAAAARGVAVAADAGGVRFVIAAEAFYPDNSPSSAPITQYPRGGRGARALGCPGRRCRPRNGQACRGLRRVGRPGRTCSSTTRTPRTRWRTRCGSRAPWRPAASPSSSAAAGTATAASARSWARRLRAPVTWSCSRRTIRARSGPRRSSPRSRGREAAAPRSRVIEERRAAIARPCARPRGTVLIAGKGHEDTQTVGERVLPFSDREEARLALAEAGWAA
jgi:UDP-N-acetylmuramoyl-L-alanyl-D-glutamate--2,6-diaminopimelate ligase